jgi:hypothetical protein
VLKDFRDAGASGREVERDGPEGKAGGRAEGFIRLLHAGARESGRFESRRAAYAVRRAASVARRGDDRADERFRRPLQHGRDLFATERSIAPDSEAKRICYFVDRPLG